MLILDTTLDRDFPNIPLQGLVKHTKLSYLMKNPLFDFPGRFFLAIWWITSYFVGRRRALYDFLTPTLTFETKETLTHRCTFQIAKHQNGDGKNGDGKNGDDETVTAEVLSKMHVQFASLNISVLKSPIVYVGGKQLHPSVGRDWLYAVAAEKADEPGSEVKLSDGQGWVEVGGYHNQLG
ncbi:hypothetical protein HK097_007354 [Rhizophlyctis rosea]|uniref:Uncharacterized protein n=1 Tax=Rhizophlyctis rosea TaxID=64517 RepID=A0AAD5SEV6_9FUNG|nr:hypothetical protein HK097_007354 [Rhizophlyctis rosea]